MYRSLGSLMRNRFTSLAQVRKQLGELPGNWIVLFLVAPDRHVVFNIEGVRFLMHELGLRGVDVMVKRP